MFGERLRRGRRASASSAAWVDACVAIIENLERSQVACLIPAPPRRRHRTAIRAALARRRPDPGRRRPLRAASPRRSFYEDFPLGRGWVEALPAYSEHLVRDVGGLFLATGAGPARRRLDAAAAARDRRRGLVPAVLGPARDLPLPQPRPVLDRRRDRQRARARGDRRAAALGPVRAAPPEPRTRRRARAAPRPPATATRGSPGYPEDTRNPLVRVSYRESRRRYGEVVDPLRIYAHHPKVMLGYAALEARFGALARWSTSGSSTWPRCGRR